MAYNSIIHNMSNLFPTFYVSSNLEFNVDVDEISEIDPKMTQPICSNIILKSHQLSLLHKCIEYENAPQTLSKFISLNPFVNKYDYFKTNIGIIADRVGSGKSYVMLSIILCNNIIDNDNVVVKSSGLNNITYYFKDSKRVIKTNLIVIPHNLCSQWQQYIKNFNTNLKFKIINKQKIFEAIKEDEDIEEYDLIVVTATFFNKLSTLLNDKNIKLQRIFFDESDSLNIPGCVNIEANFIWFITASYSNMIYPRGFTKFDTNKNQYIWCANGIRNSGFIKNIFLDLYSNIPKEFIKVIIVKNSESYIESSLQLPELFIHTIKCRTPNTIQILHGLVDKNIIDSLNAGDTSMAISYININNKGTEDNIITLLIDKFNKQLINLQLRYDMTNDFIYDDERNRESERLNLSKRQDEIKIKSNLIIERVQSNNICAICYDNIENKTITKCCQNSFCFTCIHIWLSKKPVCPICKAEINSDMLFVVDKKCQNKCEILDDIPIDEMHETRDKLHNLEILLNNKKKLKILIFSGYEYTFNKMIPILDKLKIKYDYIKGNGDQINSTINKYKSDIIDVLLINTKNYGTGMNLENTDCIIMFHKFDTQLENQVIGRAHRLGRKKPLNVFYLLHENEIKKI